MDRKTDEPFVLHIRDAVELIQTWVKGKTVANFEKYLKLQSAVIRQLEIIGEAVKHISPGLKMEFPDIPWRPIADTRNTLIHGYFSVDNEKVWGMVMNDIPKLKKQIFHILEK